MILGFFETRPACQGRLGDQDSLGIIQLPNTLVALPRDLFLKHLPKILQHVLSRQSHDYFVSLEHYGRLVDGLSRLFQACPVEQLLDAGDDPPLNAATTSYGLPSAEKLRLQKVVIALLEGMKDKSPLMNHARWLISLLNVHSNTGDERKVSDEALLALVKQAFADGAAAAGTDLGADADADAEARAWQAGDGGGDDAHKRQRPLSADEAGSMSSIIKGLLMEPEKTLYAFERGVLPHYLFQPSVGDLVELATGKRHLSHVKTAFKILFKLPWKWVVPVAVSQAIKARCDDEEAKVGQLEKLLTGWDPCTEAFLEGIREESEQLLDSHAEVIVSAVLQSDEEQARKGDDDSLICILLILSRSTLYKVIKEMLIPAASWRCYDIKNGSKYLAESGRGAREGGRGG